MNLYSPIKLTASHQHKKDARRKKESNTRSTLNITENRTNQYRAHQITRVARLLSAVVSAILCLALLVEH